MLTFIAFFVILFTKKYPESLFNIVAMTRRYQFRVLDVLPVHARVVPAVHLRHDDAAIRAAIRRRSSIEYPRELNRWAPLYKWFLAIPHYIVLAILGIGVGIIILISFFVVLITGKWNEGMRRFVLGVVPLGWRVTAYVTLMTDEYPPFSLD